MILMLALAIPAFRETADDDWLKKSDLAVSFLDRYGNPIGSRGIKHNDSIPLEDFPDNLIKATLATEDRRFYDHFGIDFPGLARALVTNAQAGGVRQGGSSITQQLAKNLFLNNERTIERKVKEAFLAIWLETRLTKNEILKLYLDRAYMGGGTFGVDGAAHFYFNKSARDVTLAESAMAFGPELKDLVLRRVGSLDGIEFQKAMKRDHPLAMEYIARLLRRTVNHNGPVKRHEIDAWLRRDAVDEFQSLLGVPAMTMFHQASLNSSTRENIKRQQLNEAETARLSQTIKALETQATDDLFRNDIGIRGVSRVWLARMREKIPDRDIWMSGQQLVEERSGIVDRLVRAPAL